MSTEPVAALEVPTQRARSPYVIALSLANLGIYLGFFTPIQNLLPRMSEVIDLSNKEHVLAVVTGAGAFVAVVANPLAGALSDRTTSRFGRRRPWVFWGSLIGALGIIALTLPTNGTLSKSVLFLAIFWCIGQFGLNTSYSAVTASIPDRTPVDQRGVVSGWVGLTQAVGVVIGVAIVTAALTGLMPGTYAIAALSFLLVIPFLLTRDAVLPKSAVPAFKFGAFMRGFYVSPKKYPDFSWAWLTRFLVSLGNAMATIYLLFFLQDAVKIKNPDQGQLILIVIYTLGIIVTTVVFGMWSDRMGRRKIFVIWSTVLMAIAAVILALFHTFPAAMGAAAILGIGYGAYLAVDQALITQVLPAQIHRARDLGVINIANSLPQVLAPVIAARIVKGHLDVAGLHWLTGYTGLYLATAAITLLAAILVNPIKSVR